MTVNCGHYVQGRCLGIFESVEQARVDLKDLPRCLRESEVPQAQSLEYCSVKPALDSVYSRRQARLAVA